MDPWTNSTNIVGFAYAAAPFGIKAISKLGSGWIKLGIEVLKIFVKIHCWPSAWKLSGIFSEAAWRLLGVASIVEDFDFGSSYLELTWRDFKLFPRLLRICRSLVIVVFIVFISFGNVIEEFDPLEFASIFG